MEISTKYICFPGTFQGNYKKITVPLENNQFMMLTKQLLRTTGYHCVTLSMTYPMPHIGRVLTSRRYSCTTAWRMMAMKK